MIPKTKNLYVIIQCIVLFGWLRQYYLAGYTQNFFAVNWRFNLSVCSALLILHLRVAVQGVSVESMLVAEREYPVEENQKLQQQMVRF